MKIQTKSFLSKSEIEQILNTVYSYKDHWIKSRAVPGFPQNVYFLHFKETEMRFHSLEKRRAILGVSKVLLQNIVAKLKLTIERHLGESVQFVPGVPAIGFAIYPSDEKYTNGFTQKMRFHPDISPEEMGNQDMIMQNRQLTINLAVSGPWGKMGLEYKNLHFASLYGLPSAKCEQIIDDTPSGFHYYQPGVLNLFGGLFYHRGIGYPMSPSESDRIVLVSFISKSQKRWVMTC